MERNPATPLIDTVDSGCHVHEKSMVKVNCSELSGETKLAITQAISEGLDGTGIAFLKGDHIAIDRHRLPSISTNLLLRIDHLPNQGVPIADEDAASA